MDVTARVTSKGRVTLKEVRDALGISKGDQVVFRIHQNQAVLTRTPNFLDPAGVVDEPASKRGFLGTGCETRRGEPGSRRTVDGVRRHQRSHSSPDRRPGRPGGTVPSLLSRAEERLLLPPEEVAELVRSVIGFESIRTLDPSLLRRALEAYRLGFADLYLVASAETAGVDGMVSLDRTIDRVPTVSRVEP